MILTVTDQGDSVLKIRGFSENAYMASKEKKKVSLIKNEREISDTLANMIIGLFTFTAGHIKKLNKVHGCDGVTHYVSICNDIGNEDMSVVRFPRSGTTSMKLIESIHLIGGFITSGEDESLLYHNLSNFMEVTLQKPFDPDENKGSTNKRQKRGIMVSPKSIP